MAAERFGGLAWKVADVLFLLMFAFSVVVQLNDPDPLPWMAIYGAAALACLLSLFGKLPWQFAVVTGIIALAWAATIAPRVIGQVPFLDMFAEFEMKDIGVEESREMYGLILIGGWMAALGHRSFWGKGATRA
jgi:transmembrane protein TMEM220